MSLVSARSPRPPEPNTPTTEGGSQLPAPCKQTAKHSQQVACERNPRRGMVYCRSMSTTIWPRVGVGRAKPAAESPRDRWDRGTSRAPFGAGVPAGTRQDGSRSGAETGLPTFGVQAT